MSRQAETSASWTASWARSPSRRMRVAMAYSRPIERSHQDGERLVVAPDRPFHELSLHATTGLARRIWSHSYPMASR